MKIAVLGDVHANLPALEAVLEDVFSREVEMIFNTGDYTGYGPFPDETVRTLRSLEIVSVIGNYDRKVLKADRKLEEWKQKKRKEKWNAFKWALDHLSDESRKYLCSLPREQRFKVKGKDFLISHICPESPSEYLDARTSPETFRNIAEKLHAHVIIMGHSHSAFSYRSGNTWFINPGSVGRPVDGDPRASYAILDIRPDLLEIQLYRVEYDVKSTLKGLEEKGLPDSFAQMFIQGLDLEAVDPQEEERSSTDPHENEDPEIYEKVHPLVTKAREFTAETAPIHAPHCRQVARLSLSIYDQLLPLHGMGREERLVLELGANLHDIGWIEGQKGHNKTSMKMIRSREDLIPDRRMRNLVANLARYHRKADPHIKHAHFSELEPGDRNMVKALSSILRIADGLDWDHLDNVRDLFCETDGTWVRLICRAHNPSEAEKVRAREKGRLFEETFKRKLEIQWHLI
ncbi:MAG: YfcE family phosphodiesterase [Synergistales bacterium]|nr:YfcE family phosphodiesterase [Synergistales bacterium]